MEEKTSVTPYEEMTQTRELMMLKSMVPYLSGNRQVQMLFLIQYLEFQNTYRLIKSGPSALSACEIPEGTDRRSAMLNAMRKYATPKEQETIDTLLNLFCILDNYDLFTNM